MPAAITTLYVPIKSVEIVDNLPNIVNKKGMGTKIDHQYRHAKRFKRKYINFLPFVFFELPYSVTKMYMEENREYFPVLNDKKIKKDYPVNKLFFSASIYVYMGFFFLFTFYSFINDYLLGNEPLHDTFKYTLIGVGSSLFIPVIYLLLKYRKLPNKKHILFDREHTMITMPSHTEWDYFSIPFTHLRATIRIEIDGSYELNFFNDPRKPLPWRNEYLIMSLFDLFPKSMDHWSFYVWYMDRNRPLPIGSAFDEFREGDFARRKKEGFPPPLFKSAMPTPEATPGQQLEREAYWKDKDHIATQDEAFFSLWKSKPKRKSA